MECDVHQLRCLEWVGVQAPLHHIRPLLLISSCFLIIISSCLLTLILRLFVISLVAFLVFVVAFAFIILPFVIQLVALLGILAWCCKSTVLVGCP